MIASLAATHHESRAGLRRRISDAEEQIAYWSGKKLLASLPAEKAKAGGLALGWQSTKRALEDRLNREDEA